MTPSDPHDSTEKLAELNRLGFQLFQEKLYPQTLDVLQQVVDLARSQRGPTDAELGIALLNRGRVLRLLERNADCEADYRQALEVLRFSPDTHRNEIIWLLKNLIALFRNTGRRDEAEPAVRELLAVQRAALPAGDPQLAELLVDLGGLCYERGALGEAAGFVREALAIREAALGPEDPKVIELRAGLAALEAPADLSSPSAGPTVDGQNRFNDCIKSFLGGDYRGTSERAIALITSGTITPGLLQVLLISLQRSGQAEALEQVAVQVPDISADVPWERALLEITLGEAEPNRVLQQAQDDAQRGQVFYYTAERMITVGRLDKAAELLSHAVALLPKGFERILAVHTLTALRGSAAAAHDQSPDDTSVERQALSLNERAIQLFQQGKAREALPLFEQITALRREPGGEDNLAYAGTLYDLGAVHLVLGELDEAEQCYRGALAIQEKTLGVDDTSALATRKELAGVLASRGDMDAAALMNLEVLKAEKKNGTHRTAAWAEMALMLAQFYAAGADQAQVEALFRDALDVSRDVHGGNAPATLDVLDHWVRLLIQRRRFTDANPLCSELLAARRASGDAQPSELADALDSMAQVAAGLGDAARAESLWQESLAITAKAH